LIGGKTYSLLRDLTFPDKSSTKTYNQLTQLLNKHVSPKPLIIAERYRFYKRDQKEGESVNEYVAELRKLSKYCEFSAFLNDALRGKIVCGLRN
jgi:RNase H-fold protein (predicted Holliday junction resolvase)